MRLLREFSEERGAQLLTDALSDAGIETDLKPLQSGGFSVWVLDENHLARAQQLARGWLDQGQREALERAAARGRSSRELKERVELRRRRQMEAAARQVEALTRPKPTPLTWGLIALCVAVAALTQLGSKRGMVAALTIADPYEPIRRSVIYILGRPFEWSALPWDEPWRLITPVLVHFDILHILFNMLWLRDLGRTIEAAHGVRYLASFVLVCGVVSNIAQFEIGHSPMFAGMSGVVYGLLGLVWVRGKLDPRVGYGLSRFTIQFMLIWLALGFTGNFGIANWCHVFGLLVGVVWAWLSAKLSPR